MNTPMNQKETFIKEHGVDIVEENHFISMIWCLIYLTSTMPNILFSVNLLQRFMHCASEMYLKATKRVISYIKDTDHYTVKNSRVKDIKLFIHLYND